MKNNVRRATTFGAVMCAVLLFTAPAAAQLTLQGGAGLGIALPMGDYGGSTIDHYAGTKYGLSTGYNAHGKVRVGLLGFLVAGEIGYSSFSNSGEAEPGQGKVELSQNILSFKAGPEFSIPIPLSPVTPYLGAHAGVHIINGEITLQGVSQVSSGTYELQSGARVGLGGTAGVGISLGPLMNLDIAAHYDAVNLLGKQWEDPNLANDQRIDSYLAVNDEADPFFAAGDSRHFIAESRNISALSFTVTLIFGL